MTNEMRNEMTYLFLVELCYFPVQCLDNIAQLKTGKWFRFSSHLSSFFNVWITFYPSPQEQISSAAYKLQSGPVVTITDKLFRFSLRLILPSTGQKNNIAKPKTDKLFRFSSHFSSFFTITFWQKGLPGCVFVLINNILLDRLCVWVIRVDFCFKMSTMPRPFSVKKEKKKESIASDTGILVSRSAAGLFQFFSPNVDLPWFLFRAVVFIHLKSLFAACL